MEPVYNVIEFAPNEIRPTDDGFMKAQSSILIQVSDLHNLLCVLNRMVDIPGVDIFLKYKENKIIKIYSSY